MYFIGATGFLLDLLSPLLTTNPFTDGFFSLGENFVSLLNVSWSNRAMRTKKPDQNIDTTHLDTCRSTRSIYLSIYLLSQVPLLWEQPPLALSGETPPQCSPLWTQ